MVSTNGETKPKWQDIAAAKRAALLDSIPPEWRIPDDVKPPEDQLDVTTFPRKSGWFTEEEFNITESSANALLERIWAKDWSAEQVAKAFCKRAAAAHQLTHCLSETLFPEALETAKALDQHLARTGKPIGPLHGLPISIKDNFNVVGKDSTVGFVSWCNDPQQRNAVMVDLLREAGAVLYVKTNVPTAMMIAETVNNTFKRTVNPLNRSLTSGGSSGGESALIAFKGSPLGVGTDIGGSLRIPAACTGIYTIRPSFGRFPTYGARSGLAGLEAVVSVNGPMARDLEGIKLFAKTVVDTQPWLHDPKVLPIPWRSIQLPSKLKIGVLWHDGMVMPTPPVTRALKLTVEKLRKAGHELIDWSPEGHAQATDILARFFLSDGGKSVEKIIEPVNEPWRPEMRAYEEATEMGVHDLWRLHVERTNLCKAYLDRWRAAGIDCILCPTSPFAAVPNGKFKHVGYTGTFNILDYSAVSFPSGLTVDEVLDGERSKEAALGDMDTIVRDEYDAMLIHGMPINLQLVAKRLEEEKVLAMTEMVLGAL